MTRSISRRRISVAGALACAGFLLVGGCDQAIGPSVAGLSPTSSFVPATLVSVARSPDGIPLSVDGRPVLREAAALGAARAASGTTPFLVGGWVTYWPAPRSCPARPVGDTSWLDDCGQPAFADQAGGTDDQLARAITFRFVLESLRTGPVVAEVAVHDPRAASCGSAQAACDRLMVVQHILWTGDDATASRPIDGTALEDALEVLQPSAPVAPLDPSALLNDCGDRLPAAALFVPTPYPQNEPVVTLVALEPTTEARVRALDRPVGVAGSTGTSAVLCTEASMGRWGSSSAAYRWLVVGNAAALVRTSIEPSGADLDFLTRLADALAAAARQSPTSTGGG